MEAFNELRELPAHIQQIWLHPEVLEFIRAACGYQGSASSLEPKSLEERRETNQGAVG